MRERGIEISGKFPEPWTDEVVGAAAAVTTMGCGDACPVFPRKHYQDRDIEDPQSLEGDAVRPIRDEIERRVLLLLGRTRPRPRGAVPGTPGSPGPARVL